MTALLAASARCARADKAALEDDKHAPTSARIQSASRATEQPQEGLSEEGAAGSVHGTNTQASWPGTVQGTTCLVDVLRFCRASVTDRAAVTRLVPTQAQP